MMERIALAMVCIGSNLDIVRWPSSNRVYCLSCSTGQVVRCNVVMIRKLTSNGSEKRQLSIPREMTDPCRHTPELDSVSVNVAWMQLLSPRTRIPRCDDTKQSKMIYRTFGSLILKQQNVSINQSLPLTNININIYTDTDSWWYMCQPMYLRGLLYAPLMMRRYVASPMNQIYRSEFSYRMTCICPHVARRHYHSSVVSTDDSVLHQTNNIQCLHITGTKLF